MKTKAVKDRAGKGDAKPSAPAPQANGELVDMDEAIKMLKTTRPTFYRWLRSGRLKGMKVGRQWRFYRADLDRFLKGEKPRIELTADIHPLLDSLRRSAQAMGLKAPAALAGGGDPVATAIDLTIWIAYHLRGSDIHIAPHVKPGKADTVVVIRIRVDGVLQVLAEFDIRLLRPLMERWKTMAKCDLHATCPQDGRIVTEIGKRKLDLRVSILPTHLGDSLTVRLLGADIVRLNFEAIPMAPADKEKLGRLLKTPWGLIAISGPTGSGKTTTMYSCLDLLVKPERKVISIEDPVEYLLPWVDQVPVRPAAGMTFANGLRVSLRSDADVIMVGEIRDRESLLVAQQAAITGHLVLTSLHTEDAAAGLVRMVEIGSPPFLVADATRAVTAQRLVRKLCPKCRREGRPDPELLATAERLAREGGLDWNALPKRFCEPVGCPECRKLGFRGRTLVSEVLEMTPAIGAAIRRGADVNELRRLAVANGMTTFAADAVRRAANGEISLNEAARHVPGLTYS